VTSNVSAPQRVSIPAIGVDSSIVDLALDSTGALTPPSDPATIGWYADGPAPGAIGPALLAGHVDSERGPAVFWRLRELVAGDLISVTGVDGVARRFVVTAVEQYPKDQFPTAKVYGLQAAPVLRLVTCGGTFDHASGHYRDNVVAYATAI
jgi:sortase (surface protein transpeptidase)